MPPQKKPFVVETKYPRRVLKTQTASIWSKTELEKLSAQVNQDLEKAELPSSKAGLPDVGNAR